MTDDMVAKVPAELLGDDYLECYRSMLKEVAKSGQLGVATVGCAWPEQGAGYTPGGGLMVVGIATNGWEPAVGVADLSTDAGCQEQATNARELAVSRRHRLTWVTELETSTKRRHSQIGNDSAFWRVTRKVVQRLYTQTNQSPDVWCEGLAWTNLYKVAPSDGGNPSTTLCDAQLEHCCQLLQLELTKLHPARTLVVANVAWWWPFAAHLGLTITPKRGPQVQATSRFADTTIVFTERPERKAEQPYVDAVVERFLSYQEW